MQCRGKAVTCGETAERWLSFSSGSLRKLEKNRNLSDNCSGNPWLCPLLFRVRVSAINRNAEQCVYQDVTPSCQLNSTWENRHAGVIQRVTRCAVVQIGKHACSTHTHASSAFINSQLRRTVTPWTLHLCVAALPPVVPDRATLSRRSD